MRRASPPPLSLVTFRGGRQRRSERKAAEADAELRSLLGADIYQALQTPEGRARLSRDGRRAEAEEKREIDAYWERYHALSAREQIRTYGLSSWLTNTNKGVVT